MSVSKDLQKIVVLAVVVVVIGGLYFYFGDQRGGDEAVFCTEDVKECPDGSFVSRVPPTCEFAACPGEEGNTDEANVSDVWTTYTNEEYGYSFEYPKDYTLREDEKTFRTILTPPEGFDGPGYWFSVVSVLYPEVEKEALPDALFHEGVYPNGETAWFKEPQIFIYDHYHIATTDMTIGGYDALRVRENSIVKDRGEYRSVIYVLNRPLIYRLTHNLAAEAAYGDVIGRIEGSFTIE